VAARGGCSSIAVSSVWGVTELSVHPDAMQAGRPPPPFHTQAQGHAQLPYTLRLPPLATFAELLTYASTCG
jgi:hypothetical protein